MKKKSKHWLKRVRRSIDRRNAQWAKSQGSTVLALSPWPCGR